MSENSQPLDLLGDPIQDAEETRGRDPFEVTDEKRNKVMMLKAMRKSNDEIAAAIGCCEKTLRTYFLPELSNGAAVILGNLLIMLLGKANGGNVTAMKSLVQMFSSNDDLPPDTHPDRPANLKEDAKSKGKKELALEQAQLPPEDKGWLELTKGSHGPN